LARKKIPVNVMVAPVIPALNEAEIPSILKAVACAGAVSAAFVLLRLPYANKDLFENWLENHFPDRKKKVLNRIRAMRGGKLNDARFGHRMRGQGIFAEQLQRLFDVSRRKYSLNQGRVELTTEFFRDPRERKQYTFFEEIR
jgi:DNA repair photolyase